jgi:oligosaccharide reducing-end xylanase
MGISYFVLLAALIALISGCSNTDSADGEGSDADSDADSELDAGSDNDTDVDSESETEDDSVPAEAACAFETGNYINYFTTAGIDGDEVSAKIAAVWEQYTEGNPDEEAIYFEAGENENGTLAYVMDIANNDIRSEGMSYGMMFAVQLDRQDQFDALWNFSKTYMWHGDETHPFYEYFSWHVRSDGSVISETPAPDGEEYFAMALYFASGRFGNKDGIFNYRAEADRLVSAMKNREPITGMYEKDGVSQETTGTPIFNLETKMVRFSPNESYFLNPQGDHTDPSYHVPAFYQLWSQFGPEADRDFWAEAAIASRDFFFAAANPDTALTPDYAAFDGTPVANNSGEHDDFAYDAWRTVMNWSLDYSWWCADERERTLSDTLQAFFFDQGSGYLALYELDGTPKSNNHTSQGLVAMNAVSVLSASDRTLSNEFVKDLWQLTTPTGEYRYYDGMLYLFALLHLSGSFQMYEPAE